MQQGLGLLRRVELEAVLVAQPLRPGAQRQEPVAAHLQVVVQRLHGLVVEAVAAVPAPRRPDQRLVRVGEAAPAEIRHRVGLAPHHVVEDPEAQVLQDGADAEDVVVGADHPDRAVLLQQPPALAEPAPGEGVVGGEVAEPVPVLVHRVHQAVVGPAQLAAELQVVRRVGEDAVDRGRRQHAHQWDAVAEQHLVQGQFRGDVHWLQPAVSGRIVPKRRKPRQSAAESVPGARPDSRSVLTRPKAARWCRHGPTRRSAARCAAVPYPALASQP